MVSCVWDVVSGAEILTGRQDEMERLIDHEQVRDPWDMVEKLKLILTECGSIL